MVEDLVDGLEIGDELVGAVIDDAGVNEPIIKYEIYIKSIIDPIDE